MIDNLKLKEGKKNNCKGLVFRGEHSNYVTSRGIASTTKLNLLKTKSCGGCETCGWLCDSFKDMHLDGGIIDFETVEHGKLYTIEICNMSKDYESGIVEDYDLKVIECKD